MSAAPWLLKGALAVPACTGQGLAGCLPVAKGTNRPAAGFLAVVVFQVDVKAPLVFLLHLRCLVPWKGSSRCSGSEFITSRTLTFWCQAAEDWTAAGVFCHWWLASFVFLFCRPWLLKGPGLAEGKIPSVCVAAACRPSAPRSARDRCRWSVAGLWCAGQAPGLRVLLGMGLVLRALCSGS